RRQRSRRAHRLSRRHLGSSGGHQGTLRPGQLLQAELQRHAAGGVTPRATPLKPARDPRRIGCGACSLRRTIRRETSPGGDLMKRLVLSVLALLTASTAFAQTADEALEKALAPAPRNL